MEIAVASLNFVSAKILRRSMSLLLKLVHCTMMVLKYLVLKWVRRVAWCILKLWMMMIMLRWSENQHINRMKTIIATIMRMHSPIVNTNLHSLHQIFLHSKLMIVLVTFVLFPIATQKELSMMKKFQSLI